MARNRSLGILKYMFIFDVNLTWNTASKFEDDLTSFFKSEGFDVEIADTKGSSERVILLQRESRAEQMEKGKIVPKLKK